MTTPTPLRNILVWDAPVRVFHWLLALSFAGAYLTAESERWRLLHVTLGYTMAGLIAFRVVWGLVGTRYAKFADFVRGPRAVAATLRDMATGQPRQQHTGHNPAGALAIVALLGLGAAVAASGWAVYNDAGGDWLGEIHEILANAMLGVVGLHIAGVLLGSWLHHQNLVGSMITGRKPGLPQQAIGSAWRSVAALMLLAVVAFWWLQWSSRPATATPGFDRPHAAARAEPGRTPAQRGDDDDGGDRGDGVVAAQAPSRAAAH